jgi:GNAT superfamily N-acetyltransferase
MSGADTLPMDNPPLPFGYSPVAPGQLAQVVTFLEMTEPPALVGVETSLTLLTRLSADDLDGYRKLFRQVGENWLWSSRLEMSDAKLRGLLRSPQVEAYAVQNEGESIGLLELDFREPGTCELAFFGLVRDAIGRGFGRRMMNEAIARAWAKPIRRFWVHTCTLDHPLALAFYRRSGFRPYAQAVEISNDPRLLGVLPRSAAPHVPLAD